MIAVAVESSAGRESVCPAVAPYVPPLLKRPAQLLSFFPELYFLIVKFLEAGICPEAATVSEQWSRATARARGPTERARHASTQRALFQLLKRELERAEVSRTGGPDTVHNASSGPHGSHVVSACQNIRISRSLTLAGREVSRPRAMRDRRQPIAPADRSALIFSSLPPPLPSPDHPPYGF